MVPYVFATQVSVYFQVWLAVDLEIVGKCAQPCRLPYELPGMDKGYLLSTKDLCALEFLPKLIKAGVMCFKIEGRMKSPEYVATVTRIYRKYIDLALSENPYIIDKRDIEDLKQVFNRRKFFNRSSFR